MEDWEREYWNGRQDMLKEALATLDRGIKEAEEIVARGPWWHLRDWTARALHWLAIRVEPKQ